MILKFNFLIESSCINYAVCYFKCINLLVNGVGMKTIMKWSRALHLTIAGKWFSFWWARSEQAVQICCLTNVSTLFEEFQIFTNSMVCVWGGADTCCDVSRDLVLLFSITQLLIVLFSPNLTLVRDCNCFGINSHINELNSLGYCSVDWVKLSVHEFGKSHTHW